VELAEPGDDEQARTPAPKWAEYHYEILYISNYMLFQQTLVKIDEDTYLEFKRERS
jgi:hypothetical protein